MAIAAVSSARRVEHPLIGLAGDKGVGGSHGAAENDLDAFT
jgi:hypothetical protein